MNILILSAAPRSSATKSLLEAGKKRGHQMTIKDPAYLYLLISDSVHGHDRIYDGYGQDEKPIRVNAKDIDAIIPRIGTNFAYACSVLEHLNNNLRIFSTQTSYGIQVAANKLISGQKLSQAKLRTPKTVLGDRAAHVKWMLDQVGGLPAIAKGLTGSQGKTVLPLIDEYQTNVYLQNFYQQKSRKDNLLIQKLVDAGGKDIRAIVIDGEVVTAMERSAKKGELRANISQGGAGKKIELSKEDKDLCIAASRACGLEVSGVDLLKDPAGVSYICETNGNYGYKIEKITGDDISTPLIKYCERQFMNGNKANQRTDANLLGLEFKSHYFPVYSSVLGRPVLSAMDQFGSYAPITKQEFEKHKDKLVGARIKIIDETGDYQPAPVGKEGFGQMLSRLKSEMNL